MGCNADYFTDKFCSKSCPAPKKNIEKKEKKIDWHAFLPMIDEKKPDLIFKISRKNNCFEPDFLQMIEEAFYVADCIEMATFSGETTAQLKVIFKEVHTIEMRKTFFENAKKKFNLDKNIFLYQGSPLEHLPAILKKLPKENLIVFSTQYNTSAIISPKNLILKELGLIKKAGSLPILIFDDVRLFYSQKNKNPNLLYPTIEEIVEAITQIDGSYQIALIYDALIAFPADYKITVSPVVHAATLSRLHTGSHFTDEELLAAELCIAQAKEEEKAALCHLAQTWIESWTKQLGFAQHIPLWFGLILLANDQFGSAAAYLKEAKDRGLTHWRIDWYLAMAECNCFFNIKE
jgi:hypothetical protein